MPFLCGYSIRSLRILEAQRNAGKDVAVLTSARQPDSREDSMECLYGIRHYRTRAPKLLPTPLRELQLMRALRRRLENVVKLEEPNVIHAHAPILVGYPALSVGRDFGIPVVYELRDLWENASVDHGKFGSASPLLKLARYAETRLMRKVDAVVAICESLRDEVAERVDRPIFVAPNGVDAELFRPKKPSADALKRYNEQERPLIVYLGSFQPYEGIEVLIRAVPQIAKEIPDVKVLVVGDGPSCGVLKDLAQSEGAGSHLEFAGRVPHELVSDIYSIADLIVYPRLSTQTTRLTTPLKVLEAMAMGRPVLASDLPPIRELINPDVTGTLFRADDDRALADSAVVLLHDPLKREQLGKEARTWVERERLWSSLPILLDQAYGFASKE